MARSYRQTNTIGWDSAFATTHHHLLDPADELSQEYPYLHAVFEDRFSTYKDMRHPNNDLAKDLSRCVDTVAINAAGNIRVRADTREFQDAVLPIYSENRDLTVRRAYQNMCPWPFERDNLEFVAYLGSGTYGTVFLARPMDDPTTYFAIKVQRHSTMRERAAKYDSPSMGAVPGDAGQKEFYAPTEGLLLLYMTGTGKGRFPALHSLYTHRDLNAIVMQARIDDEVANLPFPDAAQFTRGELRYRELPSFSGWYLADMKEPLLNETQARKVASQFLEGLALLRDMNLTHNDISHNNFLLDENLNVRIIDLGMMAFGLEDDHYVREHNAYVPHMEYQMSPELALEMSKPINENRRFETFQTDIPFTFDTRTRELWRFAVNTFEMLHGFGPWENPEYDEQLGVVNDWYSKWLESNGNLITVRVLDARRIRICNEELPINEDLSQDCADALQMMFQKDPEVRPGIGEMASMPWFAQWADHPELVKRPHCQDYQDRLANIRRRQNNVNAVRAAAWQG